MAETIRIKLPKSLLSLITAGMISSQIAVARAASITQIDFESLPTGETPIDNFSLGLTDTYVVNNIGVRFGFDTNEDGIVEISAIFEQSGGGREGGNFGFINDPLGRNLGADIAAPGFENQLGDFSLRQPNTGQPFGKFVISYNSSVTEASGEIWDIDGDTAFPHPGEEQYLVEAFNSNGVLLDSILSPLGEDSQGSEEHGDAKPWTFGFNDLLDIRQIDISFVGTKPNGIGLAFNNFSPTVDTTIQVPKVQQTPEASQFFGVLLIGSLIAIFKRRSF